LESPETGSQNRRYRDLSRRQRPHARYLNRGNARILRAILQRPGNAGSHRTAWWAREDSNLQPDRYNYFIGSTDGIYISLSFQPTSVQDSSSAQSWWLTAEAKRPQRILPSGRVPIVLIPGARPTLRASLELRKRAYGRTLINTCIRLALLYLVAALIAHPWGGMGENSRALERTARPRRSF
jgi:hypothetical protein